MKLYTELADWFHLLTEPADYADEAAFIRDQINREVDGPRTLLELGSGGGNNASHLKKHFVMTLTDPSAQMLKISAKLNPECEHLLGDMRSIRLGGEFDAVMIHDAVMYMTSEADLRAAIATAFAHCRAGGVAIVSPDCVQETFRERTEHGGHDRDGRSLRYLAWDHALSADGRTYEVELLLLMRERDGSIRAEHDHHVFGVFARDEWKKYLREAGFSPRIVVDPWKRDVFVAHRPLNS